MPVAEAAGIEAVLAGARAANYDALLIDASRIFDNLYRNYQQANPND